MLGNVGMNFWGKGFQKQILGTASEAHCFRMFSAPFGVLVAEFSLQIVNKNHWESMILNDVCFFFACTSWIFVIFLWTWDQMTT